MKKKKKAIVFLSIFMLLICLYLLATNDNITVRKYIIKTDKLNGPIRIVQVTDLHSVYFGEKQEELIAEIVKRKPDIILLTGDIADDDIPHDGTIDFLKGVAHRYPCYYVSGNHEYWSRKIDDVKAMFLSYNVKILEGEHETIDLNGQTINICGVDDPEVGEEAFLQQMDDALKLNNNHYTILMAHRPERIQDYLKQDCDLILSGHTHGGQWRIPFFVNGLYAPNQGYFPQYAGGKYKFDDTVMIVGRGLQNYIGKYPRIFNPPELVIVDLAPK